MRILYIDQYFSTRAGRSGTRSYEFARLFCAQGHQVAMITTASRYSDRREQKVFLDRREVEGIRVLSFRIDYGQLMGPFRRAASFLAFLFAALGAGVVLPRPDLVFASSTPLSVGVAGALVAWLRGVPFVFEVRDLWPRAPIELGVLKNPVLITCLKALEGWIYRRAARINVLSPGMARELTARGIDANRIAVIPNACDADLAPEKENRVALRRRLGLPPRSFLIVYAGALGPANDVMDILKVAEVLRKKKAAHVHFLILGEGSLEERLRRFAKEKDLRNLSFLGSLSRSRAALVMAASDLGVTCFAPRPVLQTCSPNKLFDYLALGLPQMVNTPGWMRRIVEGGGAGFYWPHGEPERAAERIMALTKDAPARKAMGAAARKLARERFDRKKLAKRLLTLFDAAGDDPAGGWPILWQGLFDRTIALIALLAASPILVITALAVKADDGGPIFHRPRRIGLAGRPFTMLKFRTMAPGAERIGLGLNIAEGDERITGVGRFLREWSLDEIPQLFHVLSGRMRLVGPRPALPEHLRQYTPAQRRRLCVRPGLTGWAQVQGRNLLNWEEKLRLDAWYAKHRSFRLDLMILAKTPAVVLTRQGLYERDAGRNDAFNRSL